MSFDVEAVRQQFPILARTVNDKPLVYLDNAATTQKPLAVINAITDYYTGCNSNVHRGAHALADEATRLYEGARDTVASFVNAVSRNEIIFTAGTTEGINIIANGMAQKLRAGDEVIVTQLEHHANLIPWQQACERSGATLRVAPIDEFGDVDLPAFEAMLNANTKMVSFAHISNALGTVNPVATMIAMVRAASDQALVMLDGAQGIAHGDVDVQALGCDFYAFSGHKVFAPTGVGALWGKESLLAEWPVWQTGGEMISTVTYDHAEWNTLPYRLEAGTPNIAGVIGLGAAFSWLSTLDLAGMRAHEQSLIDEAVARADQFDGLRLLGRAKQKISVLSFVLDGGHPADVGFLLDRQGVAIRTGHHCAEPLMNLLGVPGTARASFSIYNSMSDVDALFDALAKVRTMLL